MVFGRAYAIRSHQTKDLYIGSTTQTLSMRMARHRCVYKRYLNQAYHYVTSFEILQYESYIELLFKGEFESKDELRKKEVEYIREMECVNRCVAGRTQQEYYEENKESIAEYKHLHYEANKLHLVEKMKQYQQDHKRTNSRIYA